MKTKNLIFGVAMLSLVLVSCSKKDEPASSVINPLSNDGTLNGLVSNGDALNSTIDSVFFSIYHPTTHKTIYFWKVAFKNGGFSTLLPALPDNYLGTVTSVYSNFSNSYGSGAFTISDATVLLTNNVNIEAWKNNIQGASFYRTNVTLAQTLEPSPKEGYSVAYFCYSNKAVQIIGTESDKRSTGETYTKTINLSLKKGWNEIVETYTSTTATDLKSSVSANNEVTGTQWLLAQGS
ncbi:MAG: hypothetical protein WCJ03_00175 [Bacteroidales bacterium]